MNFTEKMAELDKIVRNLEGENTSLENALTEFERGISLVKECKLFLEEAKQKVTILTDDGEVPFKDIKGECQ